MLLMQQKRLSPISQVNVNIYKTISEKNLWSIAPHSIMLEGL